MDPTVIRAGELRTEITLEQDAGTDTTLAGEHIPDWQEWGSPATRWCSLRQLTGREIERAAMMQVDARYRIEMYWIPGLTAVTTRGKIGDRIFNFGLIDNVQERNIKAVILANEVV